MRLTIEIDTAGGTVNPDVVAEKVFNAISRQIREAGITGDEDGYATAVRLSQPDNHNATVHEWTNKNWCGK
jgi:hypothetical protein